MKIALKWTLCLVLSVIGLTTFTSCDDDENVPEAPKVTDVYGEYTGKMTFNVTGGGKEAAQDPSANEATVNLTVKNDTIYLAEFPTGALIDAILGSAGEMVKDQISKVSYDIAYKDAALNTAQDSIQMTLEPKPLVISLGEGETAQQVTVTIAANDKAAYALKDKNLKYTLNVTDIKLGDLSLPQKLSLSFNVTKK